MKQSLCFIDLLFCTVLRDIRGYERKKGEREKEKKEKNCTEEDAGTVCKCWNVSFFVFTFQLPVSSRPDGLSLSPCISVTMIIRWGARKGKREEKDEVRAERGWDRKRKATKKGSYDFTAPEASASRGFYQDFSFVYHVIIYGRLMYYFSVLVIEIIDCFILLTDS